MTSVRFDEQPGHHWRESERVAEYVDRMDHQQEERAAVFALMAGLAPYSADAAIRILDIGSGHGPVASALLDAFPQSTAYGLDISEAMMEVGRERMARFGDRFSYVQGDFATGRLPAAVTRYGPYHVVVSARAIHHLPPEDLRTLYADIAANVAGGGCFFNFDAAAPRDDFLRERFRSLRPEGSGQRRQEASIRQLKAGETHGQDTTLLDHLRFLEEAGFTSVECFYKKLNQALVGGYKR